jgi:hypothetical protein
MIAFIMIIYTILLGVMTYAVFNLLKKVETYEDKIIEYERTIIVFQRYYDEFKQAIKLSDDKLKIVDRKGTFKSDDEVGYFFTLIQDLQTLLNSFDYSRPRLENKADQLIDKPAANANNL